MAHLKTQKLCFPLDSYEVTGNGFGQAVVINEVHWGIHLGEDSVAIPGTPIRAIGRGKVAYAAIHPGTKKRKNWGNIMIIAHQRPSDDQVFYSLYGHLGKMLKAAGDWVELGEKIGEVAKPETKENGWWEKSHLHFAVYLGPWKNKVLPGYFKEGQKRTRVEWWVRPTEFINQYNNAE